MPASSAAQSGCRKAFSDVDDLADLIEGLDIGPAHIVGNSFGGSIVLRLAARRPELFRSLSVHEPPLFALLAGDPVNAAALARFQVSGQAVAEKITAGDHEGAARQFVEEVAFGPGAWEQMRREYRQVMIGNAPTFLDETRDRDAFGFELASIAEFSPAALVTNGDKSEPYFPPIVEQLERRLPNGQRKTIAGAGHVPPVTHPAEFAALIIRFVTGATSA